MWNTYGVSLVPYPAHIVEPPRHTIEQLRLAMADALQPGGARWCPLDALSGLGPYHGVRGSPRCPEAAALAAGAAAHIWRGAWRGDDRKPGGLR